MQQDQVGERRSMVNIERHVQTVLISVVTGALVFAASYFYNDNSTKAVLANQLSALNQQVAEMRGEIRAMQSNYVSKDDFRDHELRLRRTEEALAVHKRN
jgi:hypothetical protein